MQKMQKIRKNIYCCKQIFDSNFNIYLTKLIKKYDVEPRVDFTAFESRKALFSNSNIPEAKKWQEFLNKLLLNNVIYKIRQRKTIIYYNFK